MPHPEIETDDERWSADPLREVVDVKRQIVAAGFLARLDDDNAARMRHPLLAQRRERGERAEHRITVIGAAAAVELVAVEARAPRPIAVGPADHLGLLVEMPVEQDGTGAHARHLDQYQRRAPGQADDLDRRTRQQRDPLPRPALEQRDGLFHIAMRRPVGIESRRFVRDLDVFDQGRDDRIAPALVNEIPKLLDIQHGTDPLDCAGYAIIEAHPGATRAVPPNRLGEGPDR